MQNEGERPSNANSSETSAVDSSGQIGASTIAVLPELGNSRQTPLSGTGHRETTSLLQADSRELALRRELESTAELRAERVEALREIQSSVEDVNGIMTDLAAIISDQGTTLEFVAVSNEESAAYASSARRQLERARRGRAQRQKLFFSVLAIAAIILAILIVILLS